MRTDLRLGVAYYVPSSREVVITGTPPDEPEGLADDDPARHSCDANGCGQEHVILRFSVGAVVRGAEGVVARGEQTPSAETPEVPGAISCKDLRAFIGGLRA